jgi:regulator of sigma E protease
MIDESMDTEFLEQEPQPWEFRSKPVWQRMIVICAGVIFNMILAVVIYTGVTNYYGETRIPLKNIGAMYIAPNSLAAKVGFETGDKVVAINGHHVKYFEDLMNPARITSEHLSYTVERDGKDVVLNMPANFLDRLNKEAFLNPIDALPSKISKVVPDSPAEKAGLKAGEKVVSVDGKPTNYWMQLVEMIKGSTKPLTMTLAQSGGADTVIHVTPGADKTIGIEALDMQKYFGVEHVQLGFFASIGAGASRTWNTTSGIVKGFIKLFSGSISIRKNLGGPVAIANITRQATELGGIRGFWEITAMLSITLAIMNILPIPVLDGGHLMFLIYEGITRREPSPKVRMTLQQIGFIFIIGLLIFVTFNDILRTIGN